MFIFKRAMLLEINLDRQFRIITFVYLGINHEVGRRRISNKDTTPEP